MSARTTGARGSPAAFTHFGGVPRTLLGDNARALVLGRDRATGTVSFHPAYLAFCRDWDVQPRACAPYRARTKGKTEAGVKYVKRNGLAGSGLRLLRRARDAPGRVDGRWPISACHGTTHEAPIVRFERDERAALRPLPLRALPRRTQRLRRRVAHRRLRRCRHGPLQRAASTGARPRRRRRRGADSSGSSTAPTLVATHAAIARAVCPRDRSRRTSPACGARRRTPRPTPGALAALGRDLADYAAVVDGGQ